MKLFTDLRLRYPRLLRGLGAVALLATTGGATAYEHLSRSCCHAGAACCHPGSACCNGAHGAHGAHDADEPLASR